MSYGDAKSILHSRSIISEILEGHALYLIDTDPGLDDAHAVAMATRRLPHESLAFTTVTGNVGIDAVTHNAAWLVGELAPRAPLYRGAAAPLLGDPIDAAHIHGADGLAGMTTPAPRIEPRAEAAAVVIAEMARRHAGALHLIALGPLTNIALAIALEPQLPELVATLTIMGGSPAQHGNATLNAEFNIYADAFAAETVFARMPRITLLTWDATLRTRFSREELDGFWAGPSPEAAILRSLHEQRFATDPRFAESRDFGRADPLAMAAALSPEVVAAASEHRVQVVTDGGRAHGVTIVDERDVLTDRFPVRIIEAFHRDDLLDLLTV